MSKRMELLKREKFLKEKEEQVQKLQLEAKQALWAMEWMVKDKLEVMEGDLL